MFPLIGVAVAIGCAFVVMHWWSEGMIEASEATVLSITFGCLAVGIFAAHSVWQCLAAVVPFAGAVWYTLYSFKIGGMRAFYKQRCNEYMLTIQSDPTNRAAREYLATALYNMGELDRAISEMEVAVQMGAELEAQYTLTKWQKERYSRDSLNPICRWCRTENAQGTRKCVKCGADLPYRSPFNQWLAGGRTASSRLYLILTAGVALVVASLMLVSLLKLPIVLAFIPIGLVLVALTGWSLVCASRR